jgi:DNA-binding MarR family transcriptional regulator
MGSVSESCDQSPLRLLLQLAERLRSFMDAAAAESGLTAQQAELLMFLDQPRRMHELADHKLCDPSSVTSMVNRLERDGFVKRDVDPDDRRARIIRTTAKGRRAQQHVEQRAAEVTRMVHELDPGERVALRGLFDGAPEHQ